MTKKDFLTRCDFHKYTGAGRDKGDMNALFFDWKLGYGYKYCVYSRACNATKQELVNVLYYLVTGEKDDVDEYYINLYIAPIDELRFKIPIMGSGLYTLISNQKLNNYLNTLKKNETL